MMKACFHPDQNRRTATQKSLSKILKPGQEPTLQHGELLAEHEVSKTRLPLLRNRPTSAPNHKRDRLNMAWSYILRRGDRYKPLNSLILQPDRVLANDTPQYSNSGQFHMGTVNSSPVPEMPSKGDLERHKVRQIVTFVKYSDPSLRISL